MNKMFLMAVTGALTQVAFAHTANTIAFFPFDEGAAGESAVGKTIANDVDASLYAGTATVRSTETVEGSVVYSDDVPGKYVFNGVDGDLIFSNPKSLRYAGTLNKTTDAGGNVSFADLGTALSKLDAYTVEFFWKIEPGENEGMLNNYSKRSFKWNSGFITTCEVAGHPYTKTDPNPVGANLPETVNTIRVWAGADDQNVNCYPCNILYGGSWGSDPTPTIVDGKWHHIAVTFDKSTRKLKAVADYTVTYGGSERTLPGVQELTTSEPLDLGCFYHRGRFACLRVSNKVLQPSEYMYVSSDANFYPDKGETVFHFHLEGANGQVLDTNARLTNAVPSYRAVNTNLYYSYSTTIVGAKRDGCGRVYVDANAAPSWTNAVPNPRKTSVYSGTDRSDPPLGETTGSIRLEPAAVYDSNSWMTGAPGFYMPYDNYSRVDSGSWTCECFCRFDKDGWLKKNKVAGYPRASVMGSPWGGHNALWKVYFDFNNAADKGLPDAKTSMRLYLLCQQSSGNFQTTTREMASGKEFNDGKWHHLAVVYDDSSCKIKLYLDYAPILSLTLPGPLTMYQGVNERLICFGRNLNDQTFMGEFDEVRYSRVALDSSKFLRMLRKPAGMLLIIR